MATIEVAAELVARIRREARFASGVLREAFAGERRSTKARGAIAELVLGTLRTELLLDRVLMARGLTPTDRARVELRAALDAGDPSASEEAGQVERSLTDPIDRVAVLGSLPRWLAARMAAAFADQAEPLARALARPPPQTLRANRSRIDRSALAGRLLEEGVRTAPTRLSQDGLTILEPTNPFRLAAFHEGLFEVQDEGSQLVSELVAPPPRSAAIDLCAGAGGKTLHLAALLHGKGKVMASDISDRKLDELRRRARRAGCSNVETRAVLEGIEPVARVLVDAPCSGLGVLRRHPERRLSLGEGSLDDLPGRQLELLARGASLVRLGGRVVYATCTFLPEENDDVVEAFLDAHSDFEIAPAKEILGRARAEAIGDGVALRLFPHLHATDAFFAIAMRRR